ncbi:Macrophage-stimulating protein receptor [Labeo rohita]|uniref:Macrophage-stimulating protein receptor n=1 Tax=Labeo rohita TaxID=84645 RepID=A0ABQ8L9Z8_LABRO|nr:Macrophage-stimulating protein receptor [Labeo rohita]
MNPLLCPEFILLRLKQEDLPLEGYTVMFQLVAHTTSYVQGRPSSRFRLVCGVDTGEKPILNLASVTPDPDPNKPPPRPAEYQPEPTDDGELKPTATSEPSQKGATELLIVMEPELHEPSDQVCEPATMTATVEISVEWEIAEDSITHCTTAEGELNWILGHTKRDNELDLCFPEDLNIEPPVNSEPSIYLNFPPTLPQLLLFNGRNDSTMPPLLPVSTSAHPQPTICAVGSPQVCQSPSASWLEDPSSPPSASESWTPPRPSDPAAPPRLSAPSSPPSPIGPPAPSGSIVLSLRPGLHSSGCASSLRPTGSMDLLPPAGTTSVLCCSGSAADLRISVSALVARALGSTLALRILGVAQDHRLSVSTSGSTTTCSASVGRPPGVVSLSSTMAPPSVGSTVGFHHGCGLGLTWLLLLQPPPVTSLAPPSVITSMDYSVTTLDSIFCPPPRSPSSAEAPS